jgi:signal transduction histidine kinase
LPEIKCRSQQIQQVLMNLLTNARDTLNQRYPGHHEGKVIGITCQSFARENRAWVRITVEDHGMGIPAEVQGRIFDPFFSTKSRHEGTGLGLAISHGIVKDHHGALWFETEPGQWSRFHVELPVDFTEGETGTEKGMSHP